jgi:choice-of-anchor A domain-containing protein
MITLGQAGDFGVLGLTGTRITISGPSGVTGNLGVGPNGFGTFSGSSFVTGSTLVDPTAGVRTSGRARINPTVTNLAPAVSDALQASARIAALAPTQTFGDIKRSAVITGNGGTNVISAQSIRLSGRDTLTLAGGPHDSFLFNVPGRFTLSGTSAIKLTGGVDPANVLFNILGPEKAGKVALSGHTTGVGTFLVPERSFSFGPSVIDGSVIVGGKFLKIHSGAHLTQPRTGTVPGAVNAPEPTSLALMAVGAVALACYGRQRARKS